MSKSKVRKKLPDSFCVALTKPVDGKRYIVWPGKVQARGFEQAAIGLGRTAAEAWAEAKNNLTLPRPKRKDSAA